jgi:superfamily I DNA and RNA helicase
MIYKSVKEPKRLVWAYDDLQSLRETGIPSLADLFGADAQGKPLVQLSNDDGRPQQDIILPVCYRNTPWALSMAHAAGFGVYRREGMIQCFDNPEFWSEIGYGVESGSLAEAEQVTLARREDATPSFFSKLLSPNDAVQFRGFDDDKAEASWVADQIAINVTDDELDPSDIVVIFANPVSVDRDSGPLRSMLRKKGIEAHVAGVTRSADEFFVPDSVTISGIYRAKGNEAAMVYVVGGQYCFGSWGSLIRNRNILFTAITRSRAWVRVTGVGQEFHKLAAEMQTVLDRDFRLTFRVPTEEERKKLKQIHRDRTAGELRKIAKSKKSLEEVVALLESQELTLEDIPEALRLRVAKALGTEATEE